MKKIIKKIKSNSLFTFILGGLIFGSIGIYGANVYESNTIEYSPTDENWEVSTVNEAINSLYSMKTELDNTKTALNTLKGIGDATAAQILSGKKAVVKGSTITGTMTNRGAWTNTPTGSGNVTIPAGYHNGSGYVNTATVYTNGYNSGVTAADARANVNSVNYQTGYNAGVASGKPTKTQTVSQSFTWSLMDRQTITYTFSNLSTVVGITSFKLSYNLDFYMDTISISGNTVSFYLFCTEHANTSTTISITAIGY